jgi:phosphopantetheine adenylyltransferase
MAVNTDSCYEFTCDTIVALLTDTAQEQVNIDLLIYAQTVQDEIIIALGILESMQKSPIFTQYQRRRRFAESVSKEAPQRRIYAGAHLYWL